MPARPSGGTDQEGRRGVGILSRFEDRLEQLVSGAFAKAFRSAVQPVEVAAALQREVDNSAQILSRDRRLVPNQFHVELSSTDHDRLAPYSSTLAQELTEMLQQHARDQSYVFTGPVDIVFDEREDLSTGRFRVRSSALSTVTPAVERAASDTAVRRAQVLLEVNGTRHPLDPPGIVIGRGTEADLRIDDPGVSRRHLEIQVRGSGLAGMSVVAVDLGSTNGMLVDGRKVQRGELHDGGTVKIGNTTMTVHVMSQDVRPPVSDEAHDRARDKPRDRARGWQRNRAGDGRV